VETRDVANNSRIARRLVLFDDKSDITLNTRPDGKLYVSSAVAETGYRWQTSDLNGTFRIFSLLMFMKLLKKITKVFKFRDTVCYIFAETYKYSSTRGSYCNRNILKANCYIYRET
jgi:hypothetical protein